MTPQKSHHFQTGPNHLHLCGPHLPSPRPNFPLSRQKRLQDDHPRELRPLQLREPFSPTTKQTETTKSAKVKKNVKQKESRQNKGQTRSLTSSNLLRALSLTISLPETFKTFTGKPSSQSVSLQ